ncbi:MAG TPA: hypothetical protein VHN79_11090 [Lacunisphaera sp.]|nr:hypothetical protein [Lacunisphaera sp.]
MSPPAPTAPSALPQFHVVGFSGHRKLADHPGVAQAIAGVLTEFRAAAPGEWLALSSAAAGADLLFVQAALDQGLGWEACLPLPVVDFQRDFPPEEWPAVAALLPRAELLEVVAEAGTREDAYLSGGLEIVNRCDVLLVVWDGQPARGKGGTADVVAYARALGRPVVIIDPDSKAVRRENFVPAQLPDDPLRFLNAVPGGPENSLSSTRDRVAAFRKKCDDASSRQAPRFRQRVALAVWLNVAAITLAAAGLAFDWHGKALPWLLLLLLAAALVVANTVRAKRPHPHASRCRLAAEIARSTLAIWGLPRATRLLADFDWAGAESLRRSLDVLHRRAARATPADFATFRQQYLTDRIDGQLARSARQEAQAVQQLAWLRTGFVVSSVAAIVLTGLHALGWPQLPVAAETTLFHFAPILLPVLAATFLSLIPIKNLRSRVARSRDTRCRLETVRREIAHSQTWSGLERAIAKAERVLLQEVLASHSISSFTEST